MQNKMKYSEKNIQKLLNTSFNKEYQLDEQLKKRTLDFLLPNVSKRKKVVQPENKILIGLFVIWIAFSILIFSELRTSIYMLDLIKSAFGLSLVFIPVSSIVLIILKKITHEKKLV
jgi:prolipoprotein diacylglyceryltransferase